MPSGPQRLVVGGRGLVIALFTGMTLMAIVGASAASLGGLDSNTLYAVDINQTVPVVTTTTIPVTTTTTIPVTTTTVAPTTTTTVPTPVACDSFATPAPTKNDLNGRPVGCGGGTWTVNTGDWQIAGNVARAKTSGQVTVVGPSVNISAEVTMSHFDGNNRIGGLLLNRSNAGGTATMLAGVIVGPNSVAIRFVNGTTVTTLATGTIPNLNEARLRLTRLNNTVTMRVNGTIVATATLSPTLLAQLNGTRAGLYQEIGNSLRYWDFALYPASP